MSVKVRVKNYWNGMNPSWRIGNEVEVDESQVEGLVNQGFVEELSTPEPEPVTRPRRG